MNRQGWIVTTLIIAALALAAVQQREMAVEAKDGPTLENCLAYWKASYALGRAEGKSIEEASAGADLDWVLASCPDLSSTVATCPNTRAPAVVLQQAKAAPSRVQGWATLANPSLPYHPLFNRYRVSLSLQRPGLPYHPYVNSVVLKPGCP